MVKTALDRVPSTTITNCFNHVQILPRTQQEDPEDDLPLSSVLFDLDEERPLMELRDLMRPLASAEEFMSAEKFASIGREESIGQPLTDGDIVSLVRRDDATDVDDDDNCGADDSKGPRDITIKDAKRASLH